MNARWARFLTLVLIVFLSFPLPPPVQAAKAKAKTAESPAAVGEPSSEFPTAELTVGFQTGSEETEGIGDILIPVWNPGGTGLLFVNPRSSFTDHEAEEANIGLGYRQLLPRRNVILGANAYYDYRDTGYTSYDQWGVGFEILSTWVDARANYYKPDDKKYVVATETQTSVSQSVRTSENWSDPYADGHEIAQDYVVTRTLTTRTTTTTFEQYEQALGGYDWEIGLRLPLPVKQENLEARIFGGMYDFDRDFGEDATGWKARAEVRLLSSLFLDGGLYENEDLTGSDWYAGARLSVPLDLSKIAQGRNPFATAKSRLHGEARDFSARLTEMVMRDPQIRLETSKFIENKALETQETSSQSTRHRTSLSLLPDIQFVDGDATGPGDGSAEHPFPTIQLGVDNVYGLRNVYVYSASGAYRENVLLTPDVTLWGSGSLLVGQDGKPFGSGVAPVVDGMNLGPTFTMADRTTVRGFWIQNTVPEMLKSDDRGFLNVNRVGIFSDGATDLTIAENTLANNTFGALLIGEGNFLLRFTDNLVLNNSACGLAVSGMGDEGNTFDVLIENSQFVNNPEGGANITANQYELAVTQLRNSSFLSNGDMGARIDHFDSAVSMVVASGVQASQNGATGLGVFQQDNRISLANLSNIAANNNGGNGISLNQSSEYASIGILGLPQGLDGMLSNLLGLPDELTPVFSATGPITASGNEGTGIRALVSADEYLSVGAFFDVTANNNGEDGLHALVHNEEGIAIGLAASSQNLSEIFQLGSDVMDILGFDYPLPALPGGGHMQLNNNGETGLNIFTMADHAAISAVIGAETSQNGNMGSILYSLGDSFAISAAARIQALDNESLGLGLVSQGDDLALNLVADVNASNNGGPGIGSVAMSDGTALFLSLSTDALRPLASILGEEITGTPYDLPGQTFGPVIANNNGSEGIQALVYGNNLAGALFLDTQANGNAGDGFNVHAVSAAGTTLAAFLSSDLAYDILPEMFGLDPIEGPGLGGITANENGGDGIHLTMESDESAVALFGGVETAGNATNGIWSSLVSSNGGASAYLLDVNSYSNALGAGIDLDLESEGDADVVALYATTAENGTDGLRITANSTNDDAFVMLGYADAWENGAHGINVSVTGADEAALGISDTINGFNGADGIHALVQAQNSAYLFAGDSAIDDLDNVYDFSEDIGVFYDQIPQAQVISSQNSSNGFYADVSSLGGSAIVDLDEATAQGNQANGFELNLFSLGEAQLTANGITASNNAANGFVFHLDSTNGPGDSIASIYNSDVLDNGVMDVEGTAAGDSGDAFITLDHVNLASYLLTVSSVSGGAGITITP